MSARITQSDLAHMLGVHRTTVSLALRNHPSIPVPTRLRIKELARQMGYEPDPYLSALAKYRHSLSGVPITATVAYVTNWTSALGWKTVPAHDQFHTGAKRKANELGFAVEHFWMGDYRAAPRRLAAVLSARGIGAVLLASHAADTATTADWDWSRLSVVKIDFLPETPRFHYVSNDQRAVMQTAVRQVAEAGYRRIGMVLPALWDNLTDLAWSAGFFAIQSHLPASDRVPPLLYDTVGSAPRPAEMVVPLDVLDAWLRAAKPDAIIGFGPYVLPQLRRLGWRVPHDVGFADILLPDESGRSAGVRQNCERVGEVAVEMLSTLLMHNEKGVPKVPTAALVEGRWHDGATLPLRSVAHRAVGAASVH